MQDILYFINQNTLLCVAWVAVLLLLIAVELKERLFGPKAISNAELTQLMNQKNAKLIDLRSDAEYSKGHITQAESFSSSAIKDSEVLFKRLESYKEVPVVLVCSDGISSKQQAFKLKSKGLDTVSYLYGGIQNWQSEGLPVVTN